jgi:hypothetical protein
MSALAVQAATWPLTATQTDGWVYTGPPIDSTAPTVPVLAAVFNTQSTSFQAKLATASVDSQSGVRDYIFAIAPTSTGVFVDQDPVAPSTALAGVTFTGLDPSTLYQVKVKARDLAGTPNVSAYSAVVNAVTAGAAANTSWWPNWPMMPAAYVIGDPSKNFLDVTVRDWCGELVVLITAWFYPTSGRKTTRMAGWQYLRQNYPGCKHYMYVQNDATMKVNSNPSNDARQLLKDVVDSPTLGNPNWYLRRASNGSQMEPQNYPTLFELNRACLVSGLNSLSKRSDEAIVDALDSAFNTGTYAGVIDTYYDGFFTDNFEDRYQQTYLNGATIPNNDIDYNGDGVADVVNKYDGSSTAGGSMCGQGNKQFWATLEAKFGKLMIPNATRWVFDNHDGSNIKPPLPLSNQTFYGRGEVILRESCNQDFGIMRSASSSTGMSYVGVDPFGTAIPRMTEHQRFLKPDAQSRAGKSAILMEAWTPARSSNAFTQADYALSRFFLGVCLLFENYAHAVSSGKNVPIPLDELILDIGTPVGTRSMGTLNETTLGFTIRPPDFTSGVAKYYWQRYTKGIAVVRMDPPTAGDYPSADSAVSCTLPAAGTGKKWQMINCATYTSAAIFLGSGGGRVSRSMRNQTPTLNSGADVTTVSLKPYHAAIIRLVDA